MCKVWLESNVDGLASLPPVPSVFFVPLHPEATASEAYATVEEALRVRLGEAQVTLIMGSIRRCFEACRNISAGRLRMLDIDVGASVHPSVGLEVSFEDEPSDDRRLVAFLDYLVERKLCTSGKRETL